MIPGLGRSPGEGNGNPLQYSCLEIPVDGEAWWATVHRVAKSQTPLSAQVRARARARAHTHAHTHTEDKVKFVACCFYEVGFLILSDEIYFMFLD